jgi:hypothetical protein
MSDDETKIVPFRDPLHAKPTERFFEVKERASYRECDHKRRGFLLDKDNRTATCRCGKVVDTFDALLAYAALEDSILWGDIRRKEAERKAQEDKEKKQFVMPMVGYERKGNGALVSLKCGHKAPWYKKRIPREMQCEVCWRRSNMTAVETPKSY